MTTDDEFDKTIVSATEVPEEVQAELIDMASKSGWRLRIIVNKNVPKDQVFIISDEAFRESFKRTMEKWGNGEIEAPAAKITDIA